MRGAGEGAGGRAGRCGGGRQSGGGASGRGHLRGVGMYDGQQEHSHSETLEPLRVVGFEGDGCEGVGACMRGIS